MTALALSESRVAKECAEVNASNCRKRKKQNLEDTHGAKITLPPSYLNKINQPSGFLSNFTKYATCGLKEASKNVSQRVVFVLSDELPKISAYN